MTKDVTGRAGAVRVEQLKMNDLTKAEEHGKRLDASSQARSVFDAPPLTTTGLDLRKLFARHIEGAFVPEANSKAMHVIVQFPTDLVDGEDGAFILHHARAFGEKVFGPDAIFADRLDRDEKGRNVVDLFVAPKYLKRTKREEKVAVSMTRHLKLLAQKHEQNLTPWGIGRALQDAIFDYARHDMGLTDAMRGNPKLTPGADWKSAEELRLQELDCLKEKTKGEHASAEAVRRETEALNRDAAMDQFAASIMRDEAEAHARTLREAIESEKQKVREAEERLERERNALAAQRAEVDQLLFNAQAEAGRLREEALADARQERARGEEESRLNDARLMLMERAVNDANGLNLKPTEKGFSVDPSNLSTSERTLFDHPWPPALMRIGRELALIMERIRKFWEGLRTKDDELQSKERELDQRDLEVTKREDELGTKFKQLDTVATRQREFDMKLSMRATDLTEREEALGQRDADFDARDHEIERNNRETGEWMEIASKLQSREIYIEWTESPQLRNDQTDSVIEGPLAERFANGRGPQWFQRAVMSSKALEDIVKEIGKAQERVNQHEQELLGLLANAGPILSQAASAVTREIAAKVRIDPATAAAMQRQVDPSRGG